MTQGIADKYPALYWKAQATRDSQESGLTVERVYFLIKLSRLRCKICELYKKTLSKLSFREYLKQQG
jgi:thioredoxin-related protein